MRKEQLMALVSSFIDEVGVEDALHELQKIGIGRMDHTITPDRHAIVKQMQAALDTGASPVIHYQYHPTGADRPRKDEIGDT